MGRRLPLAWLRDLSQLLLQIVLASAQNDTPPGRLYGFTRGVAPPAPTPPMVAGGSLDEHP